MQQQGRINMSNKIEKDNVLIDVHDLHKDGYMRAD